jgi:hypothetical protein
MSKKGKKKRVDMIAAQFILQAYLDKKKFEVPEDCPPGKPFGREVS